MTKTKIEQDALGQFAPSQADSENDGVASATPRAVTGNDDATVENQEKSPLRPPGSMSATKPTHEDNSMQDKATPVNTARTDLPDPSLRSPILNDGTDPNSDGSRSGGSENDPHGGHEYHGHELRMTEANPIWEMVPGGQGSEPPPYTLAQLAVPRTPSYPNEVGRTTDDPGSHVQDGSGDERPTAVAPAVDPMSPQGLRREGMAEGGTGVLQETPQPEIDQMPAESSAYTETQKPNLPASTLDNARRGSQGSGVGEESVERRANALVFDEAAGNFTIKDDEHATGVTSQDHDDMAPDGNGKLS